MERIQRRACVPVIYKEDMPNMATHCHQDKCGISLYRGIIVQWDEDQDTRVLDFIDTMEDAHRGDLIVIQEHEGCVDMIWKCRIPKMYNDTQQDIYDIEGNYLDTWNFTSKSV